MDRLQLTDGLHRPGALRKVDNGMARILSVDDSKTVRMMLKRCLRTLKVTMVEASSAEEGLEKLAEEKFDLILLDITMPGIGGVGMVQKIREIGNDTPTIMLTAESGAPLSEAMKEDFVMDFVEKPFKDHQIQAKVVGVLGPDIQRTG